MKLFSSGKPPKDFMNDVGLLLELPKDGLQKLGEEIRKIKSVKDRVEIAEKMLKKLGWKKEETDRMVSVMVFLVGLIMSENVSFEDVKHDLLELKFEKEKVEALCSMLKELPKATIQSIGSLYAVRLLSDKLLLPTIKHSFGLEAAVHDGKIIGMFPMLTIDLEDDEKKITMYMSPDVAKTFFESFQNVFKEYDEYISRVKDKFKDTILEVVWR